VARKTILSPNNLRCLLLIWASTPRRRIRLRVFLENRIYVYILDSTLWGRISRQPSLPFCINPFRLVAIADFLHSLGGLRGDQLLEMMQSLLLKGVTAGRKGLEQLEIKMKTSHDEKTALEEENGKLREENERLKVQSRELTGQVQTLTGQCSKQKTAMDALKQELETSLKCYEECRMELKDMFTQYDAQ
jgi:hypothetical protein